MPKFTKFVPGKGEGTNRYQVMEVLVMLTERRYFAEGVTFIEEVKEKLDASDEFVQALVMDMLSEGLIQIAAIERAEPPPIVLGPLNG